MKQRSNPCIKATHEACALHLHHRSTIRIHPEDRPDAILAFNDIITFAAFTAIKQIGLRIPEDVALIGFTDDVHAGYVTPKMSAIVDQSFEMGGEACRLLLKNINGDQKIYKKIVPQKLVIRETSAKILPSGNN